MFEKSTGKKLDALWAEFVAPQVKVGFFLLFGANGVRRIDQTELFEKSTGKKLDVLWAEFVRTQTK